MSSANDLPRTFRCLVLSCRKTWLREFDRDEHIARDHSKSEEAKAARRRLDDRMRFRLQLGRPSTSLGPKTESVKEIVPNDDSTSANIGDSAMESVSKVSEIETTTTSTWSPHCLRRQAERAQRKRSRRTVKPHADEPVVVSSTTTNAATVAWVPKSIKAVRSKVHHQAFS